MKRFYIVVATIAAGLLILILILRPFIENQRRETKRKALSIACSFYKPYFPYFANIVSGESPAEGKLMDGYHFGKAYTFKTYYQMISDSFPENEAGAFLLGFCEYHGGNKDKARQLWERVVAINPHFFWGYFNLAVVLSDLGRSEDAVMILVKGLSVANIQQATVWTINQQILYQQIWQSLKNPAIIEEHLGRGQEEARILIAFNLLRAGKFKDALTLLKLPANTSPATIEQQLLQSALTIKPKIF